MNSCVEGARVAHANSGCNAMPSTSPAMSRFMVSVLTVERQDRLSQTRVADALHKYAITGQGPSGMNGGYRSLRGDRTMACDYPLIAFELAIDRLFDVLPSE